MIQLWVNLPAKNKMTAPRYQAIAAADTPKVELADDAGLVRVIAGSYAGQAGPAHTFTPMNVWDVRIKAGRRVEFRVRAGDTTAVFVLKGSLRLGSDNVGEAELAVLEREEEMFAVEATEDEPCC